MVKYCEKQIKRHRGTPIEEDMYLQMGIIYLDFAHDPVAAREQHEQLAGRFPASEMLPVLANMINDYLGEQVLVARPGSGAGKGQAVEILPEIYALHNAYPNPFNPVTRIDYSLPQLSAVSLVVYDILGREVIRLVDAQKEAGNHQVYWQGRDRFGRSLSSGIYIYRLKTSQYSRSRKLVLLEVAGA